MVGSLNLATRNALDTCAIWASTVVEKVLIMASSLTGETFVGDDPDAGGGCAAMAGNGRE